LFSKSDHISVLADKKGLTFRQSFLLVEVTTFHMAVKSISSYDVTSCLAGIIATG
jgi:hypothetical protein